MNNKIRILLSGVGNRALPKDPQGSNWEGWVKLITTSDKFTLVGAQDSSPEALNRLSKRGILKPDQLFENLGQMFKKVKAEAIIISNPAEFHAETIKKALAYDLHMLIEKPFVNDPREGKGLIKEAEKKKLVAAVVQNWRSKDVGQLLKKNIQEGLIGRVSHIFFRYVRNRENPSYPAYIFREKYPLLYSMAIHHLDLFRFILQDEYLSVAGHTFKPHWSLYKSDTGMNLFFKTKKGVSIIYSGTISSRNCVIPQESMIIEGEKGTLFNESQWSEPPLWFYPFGRPEKINLAQFITEGSIREQYDKADAYILDNFFNAIKHKTELLCSIDDALQSVVILEAARSACESEKTIYLAKKRVLCPK